MSVSTCITCDGPTCKEQFLYPQDWHLPDGWLTLVPGDTQSHMHSAWHFCSRPCLRKWLTQDEQRIRAVYGRRKA